MSNAYSSVRDGSVDDMILIPIIIVDAEADTDADADADTDTDADGQPVELPIYDIPCGASMVEDQWEWSHHRNNCTVR